MPAGWPHAQVDRVRFADLDARGHLNNVALLEFFEAARVAYLREVFPAMDPTQPGPGDVILAAQHIDYRAPAALQDDLETRVRPDEVGERRFLVRFEVVRTRDGQLIAEGHGVYVGYDYERGEATPLAPELADRLRAAAEPV